MATPAALALLVGKWEAMYRSANNDGFFNEHLIISQSGANLEALGWRTAECTTCKTLESKPRLTGLPIRATGTSVSDLLKQLTLQYGFGELIIKEGGLVLKEGGSVGEDIVFDRDPQFTYRPSFNCAKARLQRERAICASPHLSLLDQELSLTFEAAKSCNPRGGFEVAQNVWWRDVLSKCMVGDCVAEYYSLRIAALRRACEAR
jgi:hypothetical protein